MTNELDSLWRKGLIAQSKASALSKAKLGTSQYVKRQKHLAEVNEVIEDVLNNHIHMVELSVNARNGGDWQLLNVIYDARSLIIPEPMLEETTKQKVKIRMNAQAAIKATDVFDFEAQAGITWFQYQHRLSEIIGIGFDWNSWVAEVDSIRLYDLSSLEGSNSEVKARWADKSVLEQKVCLAAGFWQCHSEKTMVIFDQSIKIRSYPTRGPRDPISFPATDYKIRRLAILEAMYEAGQMSEEQNPLILASQSQALKNVETRKLARQAAAEVADAEYHRFAAIIDALIDRVIPILEPTVPLIKNWHDQLKMIWSALTIANFNEATGDCLVSFKWKDVQRVDHSIHVKTNVSTIEEGAKKIHQYFADGNQVTTQFVILQ